VVSADIENFFPSVSVERVDDALVALGYENEDTRENCKKLVCLNGALTQGAPTSPLLSNIALRGLDETLLKLANENSATYTRYADDIVFSGSSEMPDGLDEKLKEAIVADGWKISEEKFEVARLPKRLKIHGLLVHGKEVRLTKGYRNKIRAFRHLLSLGKVSADDLPKMSGHIAYASFIEKHGS
jgi:retron-type reverse transcriptase